MLLIVLVGGSIIGWRVWHFLNFEREPERLTSLSDKKTTKALTENKKEPPKDKGGSPEPVDPVGPKKDSPEQVKNPDDTPENIKNPEPEKASKKTEDKPSKSEQVKNPDDTPENIKNPEPKKDAKKTKDKPLKKEEQSPLPPDVKRLIAKLQTGTDEEKIKAIEELTQMGLMARSAARALCEIAASSPKEVSRNAILALENVCPDLKEPVFILLIDNQAANHIKAINTLTNLGEQAKPAVPVVLHQIRKCKEQLANFRGGGWGQPTLVQVISHHMSCLVEVAPEDPEVLRAISDLTLFSPNQFGARSTPFRQNGIELLGELADKHVEHREKILRTLVSILNDASKKTNSKNDFDVFQGLAEIESAAAAVNSCGAEGKKVMAKEVAQIQKDLEFHASDKVRLAGKELSKVLSAKTGIPQADFAMEGVLRPDPSGSGRMRKSQPIKMKAGKEYTIHLQAGFGAFLFLEHNGVVVAQGPRLTARGARDNQIVFRPTVNGIYQINVTSFGGQMGGIFTLRVQVRHAPKPIDGSGERPGNAIALKNEKSEVAYNGKLEADDPLYIYSGKRHKLITFLMEAGKTYQIDMTSDLFNSYLFLESPGRKVLAQDGDGGGFPNARIIYKTTETGDHRIICTSFGVTATGMFKLTIRARDR
jgi:hypothetical protein